VEQRKQKLEALAGDLQALQAKMTAVEAMSAEKAGPGPVTQLAAASHASHAHIPGVKPKAKGAIAKGKQASAKAAAHDVESHDVAARDPRALPGMKDADQHWRGSQTRVVQPGYWSRS